MTKHKKLLWTLLGFLALTQTYQNCGGVRQFAAVGDQSVHESSVALPPEELEGLGSQSTVISESATPVATPANTTTTNPSSTSAANLPVFTYVVDYYLPYGSVSDSMKGPLNSAIGKVVRNSSCDSVNDSQYKCGEIPFGTIVDRNRKLVTNMNLGKTFQGKTGSKSYKFSSPDGKDIGLKVYMDRNQRAASQVLFYLPTQRTDAVSTGDKLGENIFFAITPRGHYLDTQVCAMIPGLKIELDDIELKGEARKSDALPFGIDAVAKGTITIRPGSLTFDQAFTCGTLRIVMVNGVPQVSLESFSGVKFQASSYQGLRVEKHLKVSGVLGFFDDLFNLGVEDQFKKAIQSEVTKMVNKEVAINANEVKNGVYIAKYIDQAKLSPHLEKANEEIKKAFAENGYISALSDRVTQAACASAFGSMGLPPQAQIELTRLCSSPKIKVKSLYAAPNSHVDCYKAFFDPRAGNTLGGTDWWKNSCKVVVRTEITMQKEVLPVIACLTESVKVNSLPAQNCQAALVAMAEKYAQGDFEGAIANLKNVALTEQQIAEVKTLMTNQFKDASITAAQLKKIFQ